MSLAMLIIITNYYASHCCNNTGRLWVYTSLWSPGFALPALSSADLLQNMFHACRFGVTQRNRDEEGNSWDWAPPLSVLQGLLCSCPQVGLLLHEQEQIRASKGCQAALHSLPETSSDPHPDQQPKVTRWGSSTVGLCIIIHPGHRNAEDMEGTATSHFLA